MALILTAAVLALAVPACSPVSTGPAPAETTAAPASSAIATPTFPSGTAYTPGTTPYTPSGSQAELFQYALDLVNQDRRAVGLSPVTLGNNGAAQKHAQDMAARLTA